MTTATKKKDLFKLIENQRATAEEVEELFYKLAETVRPKPKETEKARLVSLADIWDEDAATGNGMSCGFPSIDKVTNGFTGGQVIVIFGDTGHGKSMLTQNIALKVADAGNPVLFIGLEMTKTENRDRFRGMGATVGTPILQPENISLDYKQLEPDIAAGIEDGAKLIVIDHLHMFENEGHENETNFLSAVCREVKMLAIKYDVPIILVSHINEDKNRTGIPKLSDLKGSSSIKQIADIALAIYNDSVVSDLPGPPELTIVRRKIRNGSKHTRATLRILDDARLQEQSVFS